MFDPPDFMLFFYISSFNLGCSVDEDEGDGSVQGTCPKRDQVCNGDGTCTGAHYNH